MGKVILGLVMSLDGYIADRDGRVNVLYPDMDAMREDESMQESIRTTGAVIMGRGAFGMAADPDAYADHYEYQTPIFVVTHRPPARMPKQNDRLTFTFVTDGVASAVRQAQAAAGERNAVIVGGAQTAQQCLAAGLADELHLGYSPCASGRRAALLRGKQRRAAGTGPHRFDRSARCDTFSLSHRTIGCHPIEWKCPP